MSASTEAEPIQDYQVGKMEKLLSIEEVRDFQKTSSAVGLSIVVFDWLSILAVAWLCESYWHPALYLIAVMWIGSRQHAFGVIAHDAAHYLLFKNRKLNDFIGEPFLMWPILATLRSYRRQHLAHHAYLNTERDPDYMRNRPDLLDEQTGMLGALLLVMGRGTKQGNLGKMLIGEKGDGPWIAARFGYYALIAAAIWYFGFGREFLLYWVVPLVTWFTFTMRVRTIAEHWALPQVEPLGMSRSLRVGLFEKLFVMPHGVNSHLEHHYYPRVPFYRLAKFHRKLLEVPIFRERAAITGGALSVFWEVLTYPKRRAAGQA